MMDTTILPILLLHPDFLVFVVSMQRGASVGTLAERRNPIDRLGKLRTIDH